MSDSFWGADSLGEKLLVAAVGPLVTALLALFVINQLTAWAQRRRDAAETRETLAAEMTETGNLLYFALQKFWREAKPVALTERSTDKTLAAPLAELTEIYTTSRARGTVIEQRLRIYYRDPRPAQYWRSAQSLLSTRYFLLFVGEKDARVEIRRRNSGPLESGLSADELNEPSKLLSAYRSALSSAVQSLWEFKVDRRGRHSQLVRVPAEFEINDDA
ncbi:hypothetical protein [Glaciihabitans sp. dw_435]|uniref:hypothetical protein n=1 Tax=Glaciihabitans sp. dw_435 TaxID=2720081 RepID=UPI001BD39572|nr:hypothetical protein [Glaciihabitans sp. dw_435]